MNIVEAQSLSMLFLPCALATCQHILAQLNYQYQSKLVLVISTGPLCVAFLESLRTRKNTDLCELCLINLTEYQKSFDTIIRTKPCCAYNCCMPPVYFSIYRYTKRSIKVCSCYLYFVLVSRQLYIISFYSKIQS